MDIQMEILTLPASSINKRVFISIMIYGYRMPGCDTLHLASKRSSNTRFIDEDQ